jgi:hypothetical protein
VRKSKVIFDLLAKMEIDDAFEYYECEVPGLGVQFKQQIKKGIGRICDYPYAWPVEKGDIRRYILHRFPYKILFSIEKDYVYIVAIAHCHRRPDYWINRVND